MPNLLAFTVKRFFAAILVVWAITTIVFFLSHLSPYDPISLVLGQKANAYPGLVEKLQRQFGLNKPIWEQYSSYMVGLLHGELGYSVQEATLGAPVWGILSKGVPVSLKLGGLSLLLALLVGLPTGLISALRQNSPIDHSSQTVMMLAYAVPTFVAAPLAQRLFAVELHWLPVAGWGAPGTEGVRQMILPVGLFGLGLAGYFSKSFRSFMLEVLQQDYIRTARAKGLRERIVIYLHAFKNTLLPLATIVGPTIAFLVTGAFIIEGFFNIPGIGNITVSAVTQSDYPVVVGTTMLIAISVVVINFLTDVFYALVDPRVRT
jgi:ABC-type dipeptide/oligopeptide/nickel transport system permease component